MISGRGALIVVIAVVTLFLGLFFFRAFDYQADITNVRKEFMSLEERMGMKAGNLTHHLESRVNRVAQTQDEYQASTSRRIDNLEDRIRKLEKDLQQKEDELSSLQKKMDRLIKSTNN